MILKGQQLIFEEGSYSNSSYTGPFIVLKDFEQSAVLVVFLKEKLNERSSAKRITHNDFTAWLVAKGFIEDADKIVWYLGDDAFEPKNIAAFAQKLLEELTT